MKIQRFVPALLAASLITFTAAPLMAEREGARHLVGHHNNDDDHELSASDVAHFEVSRAHQEWQKRHDRLEHEKHLDKRERERLQRELALLDNRMHHDRHH